MPGRSSSSAGATYLDRDARIRDLRDAARRATKRDGSIRRAVLFGSLASGIPTPRSDADLLIVVEASPHEQTRDRLPEMLGALAPLPCPVDLFVLTTEELERFRRQGSPLLREALEKGIDLL
jgi:predicted nucleotidyltransferase